MSEVVTNASGIRDTIQAGHNNNLNNCPICLALPWLVYRCPAPSVTFHMAGLDQSRKTKMALGTGDVSELDGLVC